MKLIIFQKKLQALAEAASKSGCAPDYDYRSGSDFGSDYGSVYGSASAMRFGSGSRSSMKSGSGSDYSEYASGPDYYGSVYYDSGYFMRSGSEPDWLLLFQFQSWRLQFP